MSDQPNLIRLGFARAGFTLEADLALPARGITVLFGPSGCGKTSLLRCVAGLERPARARVRVAGQVWQDDDAGVFVPPWRRPLGYVFQEASLFEHLDVQGNLDYGRRRAHADAAGIALAEVVELLGLATLMRRRAHQLSGGERQRVAIARALAGQPRLLLLDEPLAALDLARRQDILPWLQRLRDELRIPMIYVTHAADEAARLADTLVVLHDGRVQAQGPAAQVLADVHAPVILGDDAGALLEGVVQERDAAWQLLRVDFAGGSLWLRDDGLPCGRRVRLRILARDVSLATEAPRHSSIQNLLPGTIDSIAADCHPSQLLVRVRCGETMVLSRITARAADALGLAPGSLVCCQVKAVALAG